MKKQYLLPMLGLSAMMLSTACNDDDLGTNDFSHPSENTIFFSCQSQEGEESPIVWTADSKLGFFCDQTNSKNLAIKPAAVSVGQVEGLFYTQLPWSKSGGEHTFYLYSPYNETNLSVTAIAGNISDAQVQSGVSKAHLATGDLMYASAKSSVTDNKAIPMTFKHAVGYLDFSCTSASTYEGWSVKSITLTNDKNIPLTGDYKCNLTTGEFTMQGSNSTVKVNVNDAPELEKNVAFHGYVSVNPVNLSDVCKVVIIVQKTDEDDIQLTGDITPGNIVAGDFKELTLSLDEMDAQSTNKSIDLSAKETANCYIAGIAGQEYRFKATVMGNGQTTAPTEAGDGIMASDGIIPTTLATKSVKLLWQTTSNLVSGVTLKRGYAYFTLNGSDVTPLTEGNAVIAAYSDVEGKGDILWSWHIWVTADNIKTEVYNIHADYQKYDKLTNPELMDRNLGATSTGYWSINNDNSAHGLYYQWGRKDPFPRMDDGKTTADKQATYTDDGTVIGQFSSATNFLTTIKWTYVPKQLPKADIAKYPMTFISINGQYAEGDNDLWGNPVKAPGANNIGNKSIYDPCPSGYRVPHSYVWTAFTDLATGGATKTGSNPQAHINLADGFVQGDISANGGGTFNVGATPSYPNQGYMNPADAVIKNPGVRMLVWSSGIDSDVNGNAGMMYDGSNGFYTPRSQYKNFGLPVRCMRIK